MIIEPANSGELDSIIKNAGGKMLVLFSAPDWCRPCQQFEPHYRGASESTDIPFVFVDIDKVDGAAQDFSVSSVPTLNLYDGGEFVKNIKPQGALALLREIA